MGINATSQSDFVTIQAKAVDGQDEILTPEAITFIAELHDNFEARRQSLLDKRISVQREIDSGKMPDFLSGTAGIRQSDWKIAPIPEDLQDRRVEITGPVDRKMIINALNSGARVFMADFEDSTSPGWANVIAGQVNLRDAIRRNIVYDSPEGKHYELKSKVATLMVRPRGWHLDEKHFLAQGRPVSGSLFDFGLFLFHNARELLERGSGPYFYLPKLENHQEARLWNDIFEFSQDRLGLDRGTIKATVLIENILAAFEMDEILYELRQHSAGLNCGRWDYIFSYIKKLRNHEEYVLPDRAQVTMTRHFMRSYSLLLIQTCHKRGAHAMGGMAAQIPIKTDSRANEEALQKVKDDKLREAGDGHDGTWVAHPGLVQMVLDIFDDKMPGANQIHVKRDDVSVNAEDLLKPADGEITECGLRTNIDVAIQYIEAWLRGTGCVPIYNLMEDAATAEISRAQVWQWIHTPGIQTKEGESITLSYCRSLIQQELASIKSRVGDDQFASGRYKEAADLLENLISQDEFVDFLTLDAYRLID